MFVFLEENKRKKSNLQILNNIYLIIHKFCRRKNDIKCKQSRRRATVYYPRRKHQVGHSNIIVKNHSDRLLNINSNAKALSAKQ
jgi:hypothetical protein